jgi:hypothetical protein
MPNTEHNRREGDQPLTHVIVDAVGKDAKWGDHFLALLFGVLLSLCVAVPGTIWIGSGWVTRIEISIASLNDNLTASVSEMRQHVTLDDARTAQITETIIAFDKTMTRIVVNQENLVTRVDRIERIEDTTHLNNQQ